MIIRAHQERSSDSVIALILGRTPQPMQDRIRDLAVLNAETLRCTRGTHPYIGGTHSLVIFLQTCYRLRGRHTCRRMSNRS